MLSPWRTSGCRPMTAYAVPRMGRFFFLVSKGGFGFVDRSGAFGVFSGNILEGMIGMWTLPRVIQHPL